MSAKSDKALTMIATAILLTALSWIALSWSRETRDSWKFEKHEGKAAMWTNSKGEVLLADLDADNPRGIRITPGKDSVIKREIEVSWVGRRTQVDERQESGE